MFLQFKLTMGCFRTCHPLYLLSLLVSCWYFYFCYSYLFFQYLYLSFYFAFNEVPPLVFALFAGQLLEFVILVFIFCFQWTATPCSCSLCWSVAGIFVSSIPICISSICNCHCISLSMECPPAFALCWSIADICFVFVLLTGWLGCLSTSVRIFLC